MNNDELISNSKAASQSIWVMELHNGSDNRLTRYMIEKAFLPALDYVELEWRKQWEIAHKRGSTRKAVPGSDASLQSNWKYNSARLDFDSNRDDFDGSGALIITGNLSQDKYFCNGNDHLTVYYYSLALVVYIIVLGLDFYEATSQESFFLGVFTSRKSFIRNSRLSSRQMYSIPGSNVWPHFQVHQNVKHVHSSY